YGWHRVNSWDGPRKMIGSKSVAPAQGGRLATFNYNEPVASPASAALGNEGSAAAASMALSVSDSPSAASAPAQPEMHSSASRQPANVSTDFFTASPGGYAGGGVSGLGWRF